MIGHASISERRREAWKLFDSLGYTRQEISYPRQKVPVQSILILLIPRKSEILNSKVPFIPAITTCGAGDFSDEDGL